MNFEPFRQHLQQELIRRYKANPSYSLRAFARDLAVQPATLSHVVRGKRAITPKMFHQLAKGLGLSPEKAARFEGKRLGNGLRKYHSVELDTFALIADWYHFAILELAKLRRFVPDSKWIARTLGVSVAEVNASVERLVRLEFIEILPDGSWKLLQPDNTTSGSSEYTTVALRKLQKQLLEHAIKTLTQVPIERRDHSGMTVAVNCRDLPEIKNHIKRFRLDLAAFAERDPEPDHVYQLAVSFFPLTRHSEESSS